MRRREMVRAVRWGASIRTVARRFAVEHTTVRRWVERAKGCRLDRVDFSDRPSTPHHVSRSSRAIEELAVALRQTLKTESALGEYGAAAIRRTMSEQGVAAVPSVRTIGRILARQGALDGRCRRRFPPPPRGWYLPDVCAGLAELESFDIIEDLRLQGGPFVDVLTGMALHGNAVLARPTIAPVTAQFTIAALLEHWRDFGLPLYAQFDNDTRFQGAHQHPDSISRIMRLCLSLGITPVFVPPRETGFQAAIENFNGRWQRAAWGRFHHSGIESVSRHSLAFVAAIRERSASRLDQAPPRRPFPSRWHLDFQDHPSGNIIYIRRTSEVGNVSFLGRSFHVSGQWLHRLVRCHVNLDHHYIRFFALRRRDPLHQPQLHQIEYRLPKRRFLGS